MVMYKGFSTLYANKEKTTNLPNGIDGGTGSITNPIIPSKKFSIFDDQLVILDFLNALNIPQGQKVGNPAYGTTIWSYIFEPNTTEIQNQLEAELRRVASADPRLILNTVSIYPYENGILIEVELAVNPQNKVQQLQINFDRGTGIASIS